MSTDVNILPTGDGDIGPTGLLPSSSRYAAVDDPVGSPDYYSSYLHGEGSSGLAAGHVLFTFPSQSIPSGSSINYVSVTCVVCANSLTGISVRPAMKVEGSYYDSLGSAQSVPANTTWYTYTQNVTTNPKSGVSWTSSDINGSGSNDLQQFGLYCVPYFEGMAYGWPYITQVYMTVNYSPPSSYSFPSGGPGDFPGVYHFVAS